MAANRPHSSANNADEPQSSRARGTRLSATERNDEYFMAVAFLTSERSKDPCTQVGACIVNKEKKIVGVGYNDMPTGSGDTLPWGKEAPNKLDQKHMYVCHAELNAIMNAIGSVLTDLAGCTIYITHYPCNECAKLITRAGIKEAIYFSDEKKNMPPKYEESEGFMKMAGVVHKKYKHDNMSEPIHLNLTSSDKEGATDRALLTQENRDNTNKKRENYLDSDNYFMALANLSTRMCAEDQSIKSGACIVNSANKIVGIGYAKRPENNLDKRPENNLYVYHAEVEAIMNKNCADVHGCTIYVTKFPCNECAKMIILAGIKRVVCLPHEDEKEEIEITASKKMLDAVKIPYEPYYKLPEITILINLMESTKKVISILTSRKTTSKKRSSDEMDS